MSGRPSQSSGRQPRGPRDQRGSSQSPPRYTGGRSSQTQPSSSHRPTPPSESSSGATSQFGSATSSPRGNSPNSSSPRAPPSVEDLIYDITSTPDSANIDRIKKIIRVLQADVNSYQRLAAEASSRPSPDTNSRAPLQPRHPPQGQSNPMDTLTASLASLSTTVARIPAVILASRREELEAFVKLLAARGRAAEFAGLVAEMRRDETLPPVGERRRG